MKWLLCALTLGASILVVTGHAANPRDPYDPSVKADLYYACADEIKLAEATSPQTAWFRYAWAHQFKNFQQPGIFFDKLKKETRPQWIPFHYLYACASVTYIVQQKNGVGSGKEALTQWRKLRSYFDQKYMAGKPSLYPAPSSRAESSPDQRTSPTTIAIAPTGSAETPGAVNQPEADAERERKEARRRQRREAWAALKPAVDDTANRNPNKARKLATLEALTAKPTDGDNRVSKALNLYAENLERRYPNTAGNSPSGSGTGTGVSPARQMESTGSPSAANRTGGYTSPGNMPSREIAACDSDIKNKQLESRNWSGDANERANRLGRYQKQLFEGRCAGHPQAHAYIAGANRMLGYRRDASTSIPASGRQPTDRGNSSGDARSSERSSSSQSPQSSSSSRNRINYVGGHKECIKFTPGKPPKPKSGNVHWFTYYNGCNITLKVCDNMSGKHWGCGYEIKPGKTAKNWDSTANINRNGGNFFACSTSENGKFVHFDKVAHRCFYYN